MPRVVESGTFLGRALGLLGDDLPAIAGLSLLVWSPRLLLALAPLELPDGAVGATTFGGFFLTFASAVLLVQVQTAVLAWRLLGRAGAAPPPTPAGALRTLGAALAVAVLTALGFAFFLVPGWIVLSALFVALPALVAESLSPRAALVASVRLTEGHKLPLFALVLMFSVIERGFDLSVAWLGVPAVVGALGAVLVATLQAVTAIAAYEELARLAAGEPPREDPVPPPPERGGRE